MTWASSRARATSPRAMPTVPWTTDASCARGSQPTPAAPRPSLMSLTSRTIATSKRATSTVPSLSWWRPCGPSRAALRCWPASRQSRREPPATLAVPTSSRRWPRRSTACPMSLPAPCARPCNPCGSRTSCCRLSPTATAFPMAAWTSISGPSTRQTWRRVASRRPRPTSSCATSGSRPTPSTRSAPGATRSSPPVARSTRTSPWVARSS